jgi:hypothetical protein
VSTAHDMSRARIGGCVGGGPATSDVSRWLGLAAAPSFAIMGLWTALVGVPPDIMCMAMPAALPIGGMTLMYLLMSVFHLSPWLTLIASRRQRTFPSSPAARP